MSIMSQFSLKSSIQILKQVQSSQGIANTMVNIPINIHVREFGLNNNYVAISVIEFSIVENFVDNSELFCIHHLYIKI